MKNIIICAIIVSLFSSYSFAQRATQSRVVKKMEVTQKDSDTIIDLKPLLLRRIKSYHVEENINLKFGGYTTTYEVSNLSLINIYDLGPNNTRVITPCYAEIKQLDYNKLEATQNLNKKKLIEPIKTDIIIPHYNDELPKQNQLITIPKSLITNDTEVTENSKKSEKYIYVHLIETYQRIADKGTKSIEIFQKLGDAYFFNGEYTKAVKWYGELFTMTADLDSEYYDRYVYSLRVLGKNDKANEIIKNYNLIFGININK